MADEPDSYLSEPAPSSTPWTSRPRPRGRPRRLARRPDVPFISTNVATSPALGAQDTDDELISSIQLPSATFGHPPFTTPASASDSDSAESEATTYPVSETSAGASVSGASIGGSASAGATGGSVWNSGSDSDSAGSPRATGAGLGLGLGTEDRHSLERLQRENDLLRDEKDTLQEETAQLHDLLNAINGRLEDVFDDPEVREALAEDDQSASGTHTTATEGHRRQRPREPEPADMDNISYLVRIVNMVKNTARTRRWLREQGGPDHGILAAMNDLAGLHNPGSATHGNFPPLGRRRASDAAGLLVQTALSPRTMPGFSLAELLEAAGGRAANEEAVADHDEDEDDEDAGNGETDENEQLRGVRVKPSHTLAAVQRLQEVLDRVTNERDDAVAVAEKALQERDAAVAEKEQAEKESEQLRQLLDAVVDENVRYDERNGLTAADDVYKAEAEAELYWDREPGSAKESGQNLLDEMGDEDEEEEEDEDSSSPHLPKESLNKQKSVQTSEPTTPGTPGVSRRASMRPVLSRQPSMQNAQEILHDSAPVDQPIPPVSQPLSSSRTLVISEWSAVLSSLLDVLLSILEMMTVQQWHNLVSVGSWLLEVLAVPTWMAMRAKMSRPNWPELKMPPLPPWMTMPAWMNVPLQSTAPKSLSAVVWLIASAWHALPPWLSWPQLALPSWTSLPWHPLQLVPVWLETRLRKTDHWIQTTVQNYQTTHRNTRSSIRSFPRDAVAQLLLYLLILSLIFCSFCALGERNIWLDHNADYQRTYLHHRLYQYRHSTGSWARLSSATSPADEMVSSFYWYVGIPIVIDPRLFLWTVTYYAAYWSDWARDLVHWLRL